MRERASASETYTFRSPNTSARTINAVPLWLMAFTYGMALYRQYYNDKVRVFPFIDPLLLTHFSDTLFPIHFVQRHFFMRQSL